MHRLYPVPVGLKRLRQVDRNRVVEGVPIPQRRAHHPTIRRVGIVLPARDEADRVADAVVAIGEAAAAVVHRVDVSVMVVDHGSADATRVEAARALDVIRQRGARTGLISATRGGVGTARHIGISALTDGWEDPAGTWVLSTDADSRVRPDWIRRYLRHAEAGAMAVAGIVDLFDDGEADDFRDRWRCDYGSTLMADGRHPHAHAANLGVRLDAYRSVGGFRDVGPADDRDLWSRLRRSGVEPVADASIVVDTSGRRAGRVPTGFAHALATLYPADRDRLGDRPLAG